MSISFTRPLSALSSLPGRCCAACLAWFGGRPEWLPIAIVLIVLWVLNLIGAIAFLTDEVPKCIGC